VITDRVFYVYKSKILGRWFTRCYPIPYGIIIPDPKKDSSEKLGEIVQGYAKPNVLVRLFSPWLYRPSYYKYFDSWERPMLPSLPSHYNVTPVPEKKKKNLFSKGRPPAQADSNASSSLKLFGGKISRIFSTKKALDGQKEPDQPPESTPSTSFPEAE
jgi:hypothetical protein